MSYLGFCLITYKQDIVHWETEADIETLVSLLKILPDLLPCELAILCRKPCREVKSSAIQIGSRY